MFQNKNFNKNEMGMNVWENFYKNIFPELLYSDIDYFGVHCPVLDEDFTLEELMYSIESSKENKSTGPDLIKNELFNSLPPSWSHYLLNMFNKIWTVEVISSSWYQVHTNMLFKMGILLILLFTSRFH